MNHFLRRIDFQGLSRKTCANRFFLHFEHFIAILDAFLMFPQINTRLFRCGIVQGIFVWFRNGAQENVLLLTVAKAWNMFVGVYIKFEINKL